MRTLFSSVGSLLRTVTAALCLLAALVCVTVMASGPAKETTAKQRQTLTVSKDGKFLLDPTGKKVEQYLKSAKAFVPMKVKDKQGVEFDPAHPRVTLSADCHPHPCNCGRECIRWDEHGTCNGWANHCDICCD